MTIINVILQELNAATLFYRCHYLNYLTLFEVQYNLNVL